MYASILLFLIGVLLFYVLFHYTNSMKKKNDLTLGIYIGKGKVRRKERIYKFLSTILVFQIYWLIVLYGEMYILSYISFMISTVKLFWEPVFIYLIHNTYTHWIGYVLYLDHVFKTAFFELSLILAVLCASDIRTWVMKKPHIAYFYDERAKYGYIVQMVW